MQFLSKLADLFGRIVTGVGKAVTWLAFALIAVIMFDVVTRRFFVLGSTKLQELEWHIHTVLFMFCVGFAYVADAHVRIDLARERLSARTRCWIEFLGCLLFAIPYTALLFYLSIDFAYASFVQGEVSSAGTGLPHRWIIKALLSVGFVLLLLGALCVMLRNAVVLFGAPALAEKARATLAAQTGFAAVPAGLTPTRPDAASEPHR
jgi:TRAP-type mannitol/chloroaromatic compound transport system permease small subunit